MLEFIVLLLYFRKYYSTVQQVALVSYQNKCDYSMYRDYVKSETCVSQRLPRVFIQIRRVLSERKILTSLAKGRSLSGTLPSRIS